MRIVVSGYMIRYPLAGNVLAFLQYVLGLRSLGHEVCYVEESGWEGACYDPHTRSYGDDPSTGVRTVTALLREHKSDVPVIYVQRDGGRIFGSELSEFKRLLRGAELLLNIGGVSWLEEFRLCPRRAFVDMDPLFTQLGVFGAEALREHQRHFSYGANIGQSDCVVPTLGIDWVPTLPPVVMGLWHSPPNVPDEAALTTVTHWNAYKSVNLDGECYGQKSEEFLRLLPLPGRVRQKLELALTGGSPGVRQKLEQAGWSLRDATETSASVSSYRAYITASRGEFSVAKNAYVKARSGWFSDRSACYLAAGLPVILQDTGFSDSLPTGRGLLAFSTLDDAARCIEDVNADYTGHRRAARELASQRFDHRVVLPRLLHAACAEA